MAEKILDVTGLSCPLPVLKARRLLREMKPGQTLEVLATDPGALEDFPIFANLPDIRCLMFPCWKAISCGL